jgi:hypothetical protein
MELVVFSLNYSPWSLRAWLALDHAGAPFQVRHIGGLVDEGWREQLLAISGAAKVPILLDGELTLHESLAICLFGSGHGAQLVGCRHGVAFVFTCRPDWEIRAEPKFAEVCRELLTGHFTPETFGVRGLGTSALPRSAS